MYARKIVDTHFHASCVPAQIVPNNMPFLIHEEEQWKALLVELSSHVFWFIRVGERGLLWSLFSIHSTVGWGIWLVYFGLSYWCICLTDWTSLGCCMPGLWLSTLFCCCSLVAYICQSSRWEPCNVESEVGYLLMAKPVAFNQLRIRHDCV